MTKQQATLDSVFESTMGRLRDTSYDPDDPESNHPYNR